MDKENLRDLFGRMVEESIGGEMCRRDYMRELGDCGYEFPFLGLIASLQFEFGADDQFWLNFVGALLERRQHTDVLRRYAVYLLREEILPVVPPDRAYRPVRNLLRIAVKALETGAKGQKIVWRADAAIDQISASITPETRVFNYISACHCVGHLLKSISSDRIGSQLRSAAIQAQRVICGGDLGKLDAFNTRVRTKILEIVRNPE